MSGNVNIPIAEKERIEYRKKMALKILKIFEAEKLDIETCELVLFEAKSMLKIFCRVYLEKPVTAATVTGE